MSDKPDSPWPEPEPPDEPTVPPPLPEPETPQPPPEPLPGPPPPTGVGGAHRAGGPPYSGPGGTRLAVWPVRAQSAIIDWFLPSLIATVIGQRTSYASTEFTIVATLALAWALYNAYLGGSTGQSIGKRWAGTRVVRAHDGELLGGGMGIVRHLLHVLDNLACYLGFLWPLWDAKRQTFADKIVRSVVVLTPSRP